MKLKSIDEFIEKGKKAIIILEERAEPKNDEYWLNFYNEQKYAIEVLIEALSNKPINYTKVISLANIFESYFEKYKPPIMYVMCSSLKEFIKSNVR